MTRILTQLGGGRVTLGVPLVLIALGDGTRGAGLMALVANALSHSVVQLLKRLVQRPRPCDARGNLLALVDLPDPFSFPSGHAAAATAVALSASLTAPALAPVLVPLAGWVAWTRVALRVHYPGDVAAGMLLGALGAVAARALLR